MMFRKALLSAGMLLAAIGGAYASDITDLVSGGAYASLKAPTKGGSFKAGTSVTFTSEHKLGIERTDGPYYNGTAAGTWTFMNGAGFVPGNIYITVANATAGFSWINGDGGAQWSPSSGNMTISATHSFGLSPSSWDSFAKTKWQQTSPTTGALLVKSADYGTFTVTP
ncbi:MAG: hypothetical protein NT023_24140 [Armatimonadetes bacterium]|nr:hypothetical protein [Armatimonadota bacterium]